MSASTVRGCLTGAMCSDGTKKLQIAIRSGDLKLAQPTDFANPDTAKVSIGTVVTLDAVGGGESLSYTVLGAWDSDPDNGIIAYLSERGNAILDKEVGVDVDFPLGDGGMKRYRITSIKAYKS